MMDKGDDKCSIIEMAKAGSEVAKRGFANIDHGLEIVGPGIRFVIGQCNEKLACPEGPTKHYLEFIGCSFGEELGIAEYVPAWYWFAGDRVRVACSMDGQRHA
jgi:hypothetical protein